MTRLRKRHRVARRRIDRVDGGQAGVAVVDVLDEAALVDDHGRVHGHDRVGLELRMMRTSCSRSARSFSSAPSGRCRKSTPS